LDICAPIMSTRSPGLSYTAQGLGDRIHLVSLSYEISMKKGETVTLHLAKNHLGERKRQSFLEILSLFPKNHVELSLHDYYAQGNSDWTEYLIRTGVRAHTFAYRDHPGWLEAPSDFDASPYLFKRHLITPTCEHDLKLPKSFITAQWDSTGQDRRLPEMQISRIENDYRKDGYQIVLLGGQSKYELLRECLNCSAVAIRRSSLFAGVDSGFLHLALQVKNPSQIHFYTARNRYWSHHSFRAIEMGTVLNNHSDKIRWFEFRYVKLRYDSPRLSKMAHQVKRLVGVERYETHD
jgi:hypothetical protein